MTLNKAFAMRLTNILIDKNISKYALEKKSGLSHSALRHIFNERNNEVKFSTIAKVAQALGMSLEEFFADKIFNLDELEFDN